MLRIDIQASAINNLTDARYFAAREAKWLCFSLEQSNTPTISAIKEWVDGIEIVVAFSLQTTEEILEIASFLSLKSIQLGPFYNASDAAQISQFQITKEIIVPDPENWQELDETLRKFNAVSDYLLLDFHKNGISWKNLQEAHLQKIRDWCTKYNILLSVAFQTDDVDSILGVGATGIDLKGSEEEKVGYKSFEELDDILDMLEVEE